MNPRLKSSKKSTAFPKEYSQQIQSVFNENFAQYLEDAEILVEGRIYPEEITLRIGYREKGRLTQANFEVSTGYSPEKQDTVQKIHNCVDAAASLMLEYFEILADENKELDFPYTWKELPFDGFKVYFQFTTENSELEAEANKLLGLAEGEMILEEDEDEDALSVAEVREGLEYKDKEHNHDHDHDDEEESEEASDEEPKGPQMFSGKGKKKGDLH